VFPPDRSCAGRRPGLVRAAGALLLAAAVIGPPPALAQDREGDSVTDLTRQAEEDRERARKLREKAAALAEEVRALRGESVSIARRAQTLETELSSLETTFRSLQEREAAKLDALNERRAQLGRTLAALQRIAIQPPEAVAMSSRAPLDVVRGAMVLSETVPAIEARAQDLRGELGDLRQLRREMEQQRQQMASTRESLSEQRARLQDVMARKQTLRRKLVGQSKEAAANAAKLAQQAKDMRDLLTKLRNQPDPKPAPAPEPEPKPDPDAAAESKTESAVRQTADPDMPPLPPTKPTPPGTGESDTASGNDGAVQQARLSRPEDIRSFPTNRRSLRMPVSGDVVTRYGEKIRRAGGEIAAKGIVIETRHGGRVVAPFDGKVAYAGPFKGYGRILIIEHGHRYHSLLAGLDRIDALVGQWVLAGEPVGVMSQAPADAPELYMELRRTGRPINPLPWLAQTGNKVKG
jgi:septal ring factor EnvC (AmiA/AmiB activator)